MERAVEERQRQQRPYGDADLEHRVHARGAVCTTHEPRTEAATEAHAEEERREHGRDREVGDPEHAMEHSSPGGLVDERGGAGEEQRAVYDARTGPVHAVATMARGDTQRQTKPPIA